MPETWFDVTWPDGTLEQCYSPSSVISDHLSAGISYELADFLARGRAALTAASQRVLAKYGMPCSRAAAQLARLEQAAATFAHDPSAVVRVDRIES